MPPTVETFSLWLMPAADVSDRLAKILHRLSRRYGAPKFPPHVTLLGRCVGTRQEIIDASARVAAGLRPLIIRLEKLDFLDEYFRCLFVRAALTKPLRMAHQAARKAFGRKRERAFMPHLSLLYGDFPASLKETVIAELGPRLDLEYEARSLYVYRTQGAPRQWRQVACHALTAGG
jgi:2'-5' RNA ligase